MTIQSVTMESNYWDKYLQKIKEMVYFFVEMKFFHGKT